MSQAGIFLVDKPAGISSARAISILKKRLNIKKIGHAGTLDPMATGLLVVLVGKATRLARYAEGGTKRYSGSILLGQETDTDDATGNITQVFDTIPDSDTIIEAARSFTGIIEQVPPAVSAIKVNGQRAYRLARAGQTVNLRQRSVQIFSFNLFDLANNQVSFVVECSKGTYIRSLARDIGRQLGCGGCLSALRREKSAPFDVANAKHPELLEMSDLLDWTILFPTTEQVLLDDSQTKGFLMGDLRQANQLLQAVTAKQVIYVERASHSPLGLLEKSDSTWQIAVNVGR